MKECEYEGSRNFVIKARIAVNLHMQLEMFNKTPGMPRTIREVNGHLHTMKEGTRGYCRLWYRVGHTSPTLPAFLDKERERITNRRTRVVWQVDTSSKMTRILHEIRLRWDKIENGNEPISLSH